MAGRVIWYKKGSAKLPFLFLQHEACTMIMNQAPCLHIPNDRLCFHGRLLLEYTSILEAEAWISASS